MDEFLFKTKAGFCEHYAAAFVVLMRAAGIPARVVTGYQGGEMNGNYMIVRQANAHAWSEAFIEGAWRRFDPTGFVAPTRIEQGLSAALPFVVNYDNDSQDKFWKHFGFFNPSLLEITLLLIAAGLTWSLFILAMHRNATADLTTEEKLWRQLSQLLHHHQLFREPQETPSEYMSRAAEKWSSQKARIQFLDAQFCQLRFQKRITNDTSSITRRIHKEMLLLRYGIVRDKFRRLAA